MLSITGLRNFYFLPHFHDMRCKARRVSDMIRVKYNRDPLNGDVYVFRRSSFRNWMEVWFRNMTRPKVCQKKNFVPTTVS